MSEFGVHFGALAPPMKEQIGHLISEQDCGKFQKIADAIVMLHIHGYLSDSQVDKARQRCMKAITKAANNCTKPESEAADGRE